MGEFYDFKLYSNKAYKYYVPNNILTIYFIFALETSLSLLDLKISYGYNKSVCISVCVHEQLEEHVNDSQPNLSSTLLPDLTSFVKVPPPSGRVIKLQV